MNVAETLILLKPLALKLDECYKGYLSNSKSEVPLIFGDFLQMGLNECGCNADSLGTFGIENGIINRFEIKMKYCKFASPNTS